MIKSTCHHLFLVSHELRQIYTDARKTYDVAPNFIFGVELLDVALKDASIPVTKARVSGPWAHLAEHKSCIVLFCKNLGQAIVPSLLVELCSKWQSVPSWNNYLVATGASVLHMLQKRTQKNVSWLADKITRDFEYPTVRLHQSHSQRKYSHLGFLLSEAPAADRKGLLQAVQECKNGGYISPKPKSSQVFGHCWEKSSQKPPKTRDWMLTKFSTKKARRAESR